MLVRPLVCWSVGPSVGPHITLSAKKVLKVKKIAKITKSRQNLSPKFVSKICWQNLAPKFVRLCWSVHWSIRWSVRWSPYHFKCKKSCQSRQSKKKSPKFIASSSPKFVGKICCQNLSDYVGPSVRWSPYHFKWKKSCQSRQSKKSHQSKKKSP
jgi:hypothetical protein